MSRIMGDVFKASLHESGRCHVRAPSPTKWFGSGTAPHFLDEWQIDPAAPFVYPFGIIVPTSELRRGSWSSSHNDTVWLHPNSTSTEIGIFVTTFAPVETQLTAAGWNISLAQDALPDGRHLSIVAGNPQLPEEKSVEILALKNNMPEIVATLENPRIVLIAGEGNGTRHFVEAAARGI